MQTRSASRALAAPETDEQPRPKRRKVESSHLSSRRRSAAPPTRRRSEASSHANGCSPQAREEIPPVRKRRRLGADRNPAREQPFRIPSYLEQASLPWDRPSDTQQGLQEHKRGPWTPPHTGSAGLTASNLQKLRTKTADPAPGRLEEWRTIIERPPTPPSQYLGPMDVATLDRSHTTQSQKPRLTRDPFGYATEMVMFGIKRYLYRPFLRHASQQKTGIVGYAVPANIVEIMNVVNRSRSDLPSLESFQGFCEEAAKVAYNTDEGDIGTTLQAFMSLKRWDGPHGIFGRQKLIIPDGALPPGQTLIKPDCCFGLDSSTVDLQCDWVTRYIRGPTKNSNQVCCNGIVEYKTSGGNMAVARIQNQASAYLLCHAWLEDENALSILLDAAHGRQGSLSFARAASAQGPRYDPDAAALKFPADTVIGKARIGSICFDGAVFEASVHWLEPRQGNNGRLYDFFSLRVITGHAFAATLEEYRETYRKIANFLGWLCDEREARFERITQLPPNKPEEAPPPPPPGPETDDEEQVDEGGPAGARTAATQQMCNASLQSFDGASDSRDQSPADRGSVSKEKGAKRVVNEASKAAASIAKRLKVRKSWRG